MTDSNSAHGDGSPAHPEAVPEQVREETGLAAAERVAAERLRLLAPVSHDLRTPLTSIMLRAELLETGVAGADAATVREYDRHIHEASEHMLFLVEQIQSFARIEAGTERAWLREVDLVELCRGVERFVRALAAQKGLESSVRLPAGPLLAMTDGGKVRQILLNLLSNAVRFTDRGQVELSLEMNARGALFGVSDTGAGIPAEHLEQIFEPFWQGPHGRRGEVRGSGLGLAIARRLAELLGGSLTVSVEPGVGSTFLVTLPLDRVGSPP